MINAITPKASLSDKTYNVLKTIVQLWLPASATLYFTLAAIWDWPNAEGVLASAAAVATFGGIVLRLSVKSYAADNRNFDGIINVSSPTPDSTLYSLELDGDPAELKDKTQVSFKVNPTPSE